MSLQTMDWSAVAGPGRRPRAGRAAGRAGGVDAGVAGGRRDALHAPPRPAHGRAAAGRRQLPGHAGHGAPLLRRLQADGAAGAHRPLEHARPRTHRVRTHPQRYTCRTTERLVLFSCYQFDKMSHDMMT